MDDPKPTYTAIFGAYWQRLAGVVELWWIGFGIVQCCLLTAVVLARNPGLVPVVGQRPAVMINVGLAILAFVLTVYYEFS